MNKETSSKIVEAAGIYLESVIGYPSEVRNKHIYTSLATGMIFTEVRGYGQAYADWIGIPKFFDTSEIDIPVYEKIIKTGAFIEESYKPEEALYILGAWLVFIEEKDLSAEWNEFCNEISFDLST